LFLVPKLTAGGVGQVTKSLCTEYKQQSHNVTVLSLTSRKDSDHAMEKHYTSIGVVVKHLPFKNTGMLAFIGSFFLLLNYFMKHREPELIIIPAIFNAIVAIPAAKITLSKSAIIVNAHTAVSQYLDTQRAIKRMIFAAGRIILPLADVVANDSKGASNDLKQRLSLKDVTTLYNPCCTEADITYSAASSKAPHVWLQDSKLTVLLGCGRFVESKNFGFMIEVFNELYKNNNNLRLILLGGGEEEEQLRDIVKQRNLGEVVSFEGYVSNVKEYMYHSQYFWLTSKFEGFSIVLAEALSMGTPCIANNCPHGPREVLDNGKYGLLISGYDVHKNAVKINEYINTQAEDKAFYRSRAQAFSSERMAGEYLKSVGLE